MKGPDSGRTLKVLTASWQPLALRNLIFIPSDKEEMISNQQGSVQGVIGDPNDF